jgi:MFS transporter, YQGE family, putative transporter
MLSPSARRLVLINALFALANGLSGLFTNVYLWRLRPGVSTPAYYNLWVYLAVMITMPTLGAVVKRRGAVAVNAGGMALYAGFYMTLLLLQERAALYLPFLGIFSGVALGCYALATHTLAYDLTDHTTREAFYNKNGLFAAGANLLAPLISATVVSGFAGLSGYRFIFIGSFVLFSGAAVLGLTLPTQRPASSYKFRSVFPGKHPGWHRLLVGYAIQGMRDGLFSFGVTLLVFLATGGERSLGNFAFVTSAVGMISFWVASRVMTPENRSRLFPVGALLMGLATAVVGLGATWTVMLTQGLMQAVSAPLWQTAWSSTGFDIIKDASGDQDLRVEMIGAREIPLNLGRMFSVLLVLRFATSTTDTTFLQGLMAVLGLTFPLTWLLVRKARRPAPNMAA